MLLPSIRLTAARLAPRYTRTLVLSASAAPANDGSISAEALSIFDSSEASSSKISTPVTSPSDSRPTFMDIPPAEDPLLHFFTSNLMKHGKRASASRRISQMLLYIHTFTRAPPLPIVRAAVELAAPSVRSLMHRKGGKTVVKPIALGERQRTRFAIQWIMKASDSKSGRTVEERLAKEILAVLNGKSGALDKKEEMHKFAMVNRGNTRS